MSDANTIRILSIDGGGMRGYIPAIFMQLFVQLWGIKPNEIWKYFDIITGSSIGGISALAYCIGTTPTDLQTFFTADGPWIFTTDTSTPSVTPSTLTKVNTIIGGPFSDPTFYSSTTEGIGTMRLNSKLTSVFGTNTLQNMNTNVLITSFETNENDPDFELLYNTPAYFSNISSNIIPVLRGQNNLAVDVAMATSAAPLYFPPWIINGESFIDGGVVQNNPASFALAIAQAIKPVARRACVLSLGTGLGDVGFDPNASSFKRKFKTQLKEFRENPKDFGDKWKLSSKQIKHLQTLDSLGALEGAYLIMYLIGVMGTAPQEIAAMELNIRSQYTLSNIYNYRMQYYLDPALDTELDDSTPEILEYYKTSVTDYFNENIEEISNFIAHLSL